MPNRVRATVVALALILASAPGHLAGPYADPASKPESGKTAESSSESAGKEPAPGGSEPSGPEPFVPSEKISADSAISFPVDI